MSDISNRKPDTPEIYVQNSVAQQQNNSTENNSDCFQHNDTLPVRRVLPFGTSTRRWAVLVVLVVVDVSRVWRGAAVRAQRRGAQFRAALGPGA